MDESENLIRKPVYLPASLVREIKKAYESLHKTQHGALQNTLARGAELALEELRAGVPQKENRPAQPPSGYQTNMLPEEILTDPELVEILIAGPSEVRQCLKKLGRILNATKYPSFARGIAENIDTFTFGLEAAEELEKLRESFNEVRKNLTDAPDKGDSFKKGIARLGRLFDNASRSLEGTEKAPKIVRRQEK